jgi:UDP-3-O-[3-hydroxymyristoyl] glucosamine N-acyltransferase
MQHYTLQQLATLTGAQLIGDPNHQITGVGNLETASSHEAAFLENPRYEKQLESSQAGVIFILSSLTPPPEKNYLLSPTPSLAFQKVIELFIALPQSGFDRIHPTAVIHKEACIGQDVTIAPCAVIDRGVKIGPGCVIGPGVFIGADTVVGSECRFYANVTVREGCEIGNRVILQPGAVVGSCGFGYFTDNKGRHIPLKQLGKVILEDDVEIGANTTIDRARFKTTRICRGTKIDNLVQIAHQVELGEDNLIVSQVGIAGSTKTGRHVIMGGQVGVAGHIVITDGVMLAARSAVSKSLLQPGSYGGVPAAPLREAHLQFAQMRSLGKFIQRLKELESKVAELEKATSPPCA